MAEYIDKNKLENFAMNCVGGEVSLRQIHDFPAADVVERDEGIRIGAELAAMHGSDATSQDLERAYWTGYEEAMKKRDVRPVVRGRWVGYPECLKYMNAYSDDHIVCSACEECFSILDNDCERFNFCPNCGAYMRGDNDV